ncbi:MAG: RNA 2',3'-cyclic phosphodiesterase [Nitrospinae bacterium]|nr:RNA 2',3'-cyclic phosphodiesterase [Nitrospinota bacterium]
MSIVRAFIAISLPPHVQELGVQVRERFRECEASISWVQPQNVHLTIKFLGNVEEEKIGPIGKALEKAIGGARAFSMNINEVGVFPNIKFPRVIWMGVDEPTRTLINLENRISAEMETLGFPKEEKKFTPHITLGRIKSHKGKNKLMEIIQSQRMLYCDEALVEDVKLYKSELKPTGAVHSVLASFSLARRKIC